MQGRMNAGVDGCRGGWMQGRMGAGVNECRGGWIVRVIETDRNIERCMHYNHLPRKHCNLLFYQIMNK